MKIKENRLFHTPETMKEVVDWIEKHSPSEKVHLYTAAMMTWNYLAKATNSEVQPPDVKPKTIRHTESKKTTGR